MQGASPALCRCKQTDHLPIAMAAHAQVSERGRSGRPFPFRTGLGIPIPMQKKDSSFGAPDQASDAGTAIPLLWKPYVPLHFMNWLEHGLDSGGESWPSSEGDGVPRSANFASFGDHIQILVAQPRSNNTFCRMTQIGGNGTGAWSRRAAKPCRYGYPCSVSDMTLEPLLHEAKVSSLARGAEKAETGICSGEGRNAARGTGRSPPLFL